MAEDLIHETRDGIAVVTFNRPAARNALTIPMYEGLAEACRAARLGEVAALVVTGAGGRAFAAGTDIALFRDFSEPDDALTYEARMEAVFTAIETCEVPTIAAITGACTGGGAAIAAACDLRLCDADLRFGFPIARTLGNCLSIRNLGRLAALIGAGRVRELLLTARLTTAEEALAIGLVSEILPEAGGVLPRALELAETLKGHAPLTMKATREAMRRLRTEGPGADDADLIVECYMSRDFREGLEAFLAKRKPDWQGR